MSDNDINGKGNIFNTGNTLSPETLRKISVRENNKTIPDKETFLHVFLEILQDTQKYSAVIEALSISNIDISKLNLFDENKKLDKDKFNYFWQIITSGVEYIDECDLNIFNLKGIDEVVFRTDVRQYFSQKEKMEKGTIDEQEEYKENIQHAKELENTETPKIIEQISKMGRNVTKHTKLTKALALLAIPFALYLPHSSNNERINSMGENFNRSAIEYIDQNSNDSNAEVDIETFANILKELQEKAQENADKIQKAIGIDGTGSIRAIERYMEAIKTYDAIRNETSGDEVLDYQKIVSAKITNPQMVLAIILDQINDNMDSYEVNEIIKNTILEYAHAFCKTLTAAEIDKIISEVSESISDISTGNAGFAACVCINCNNELEKRITSLEEEGVITSSDYSSVKLSLDEEEVSKFANTLNVVCERVKDGDKYEKMEFYKLYLKALSYENFNKIYHLLSADAKNEFKVAEETLKIAINLGIASYGKNVQVFDVLEEMYNNAKKIVDLRKELLRYEVSGNAESLINEYMKKLINEKQIDNCQTATAKDVLRSNFVISFGDDNDANTRYNKKLLQDAILALPNNNINFKDCKISDIKELYDELIDLNLCNGVDNPDLILSYLNSIQVIKSIGGDRSVTRAAVEYYTRLNGFCNCDSKKQEELAEKLAKGGINGTIEGFVRLQFGYVLKQLSGSVSQKIVDAITSAIMQKDYNYEDAAKYITAIMDEIEHMNEKAQKTNVPLRIDDIIFVLSANARGFFEGERYTGINAGLKDLVSENHKYTGEYLNSPRFVDEYINSIASTFDTNGNEIKGILEGKINGENFALLRNYSDELIRIISDVKDVKDVNETVSIFIKLIESNGNENEDIRRLKGLNISQIIKCISESTESGEHIVRTVENLSKGIKELSDSDNLGNGSLESIIGEIANKSMTPEIAGEINTRNIRQAEMNEENRLREERNRNMKQIMDNISKLERIFCEAKGINIENIINENLDLGQNTNGIIKFIRTELRSKGFDNYQKGYIQRRKTILNQVGSNVNDINTIVENVLASNLDKSNAEIITIVNEECERRIYNKRVSTISNRIYNKYYNSANDVREKLMPLIRKAIESCGLDAPIDIINKEINRILEHEEQEKRNKEAENEKKLNEAIKNENNENDKKINETYNRIIRKLEDENLSTDLDKDLKKKILVRIKNQYSRNTDINEGEIFDNIKTLISASRKRYINNSLLNIKNKNLKNQSASLIENMLVNGKTNEEIIAEMEHINALVGSIENENMKDRTKILINDMLANGKSIDEIKAEINEKTNIYNAVSSIQNEEVEIQMHHVVEDMLGNGKSKEEIIAEIIAEINELKNNYFEEGNENTRTEELKEILINKRLEEITNIVTEKEREILEKRGFYVNDTVKKIIYDSPEFSNKDLRELLEEEKEKNIKEYEDDRAYEIYAYIFEKLGKESETIQGKEIISYIIDKIRANKEDWEIISDLLGEIEIYKNGQASEEICND